MVDIVSQKVGKEKTFEYWREVTNSIIDDLENVAVVATQGVVLDENFRYEPESISGLDVNILGGSVRQGNSILDISNSVLTLPDNTTVMVFVNTTGGVQSIQQAEPGNIPSTNVIPLYSMTTDSGEITDITELRTWAVDFDANGGGTTIPVEERQIAVQDQTQFTLQNIVTTDGFSAYQNGKRLSQGNDYVIDDSTHITLTQAANINDILLFVARDLDTNINITSQSEIITVADGTGPQSTFTLSEINPVGPGLGVYVDGLRQSQYTYDVANNTITVPTAVDPNGSDSVVEVVKNDPAGGFRGFPVGGKAGQMVVKRSDFDYDYEWSGIHSATHNLITNGFNMVSGSIDIGGNGRTFRSTEDRIRKNALNNIDTNDLTQTKYFLGPADYVHNKMSGIDYNTAAYCQIANAPISGGQFNPYQLIGVFNSVGSTASFQTDYKIFPEDVVRLFNSDNHTLRIKTSFGDIGSQTTVVYDAKVEFFYITSDDNAWKIYSSFNDYDDIALTKITEVSFQNIEDDSYTVMSESIKKFSNEFSYNTNFGQGIVVRVTLTSNSLTANGSYFAGLSSITFNNGSFPISDELPAYDHERVRVERFNRIGTLEYHATDNIPSNNIVCAQQVFQSARFPCLYARLKTKYSNDSTAKLPEARGYFVRNFYTNNDPTDDDETPTNWTPNLNTRQDRDDGNGYNSAGGFKSEANAFDLLGTTEEDRFESHSHGMQSSGNHRHPIPIYSSDGGGGGRVDGATTAGGQDSTAYTEYAGGHVHNIIAEGENETNPVNIMFALTIVAK